MATKRYDGAARKVGLRVTIFRPRRSNNWYLRWSEPASPAGMNGRARGVRVIERSTGHGRLELAMKVAQRKEDELERARLNGAATTAEPRRTLLDHAVRVHLRDLDSVGRGYEHRKKTRQRLMHFAAHLHAAGIRFLDEITTLAVQQYVNDLSGRLVARSVKNYATTLTGFFNAAVTYGWMAANPAGIGKGGKLKLPVEPEAKRSVRRKETASRVPTPDEYRALLAACDPWTADAVRLTANTGIRYGELMFLVVDDVDLEKNTLLVGCKALPYEMPKTARQLLKDRSRNLWWPKDATDRVIPLTGVSRDVLRRRVDAARRTGIPWLFANDAGHPRAHNKALERLKDAATTAAAMMNGAGKSRLGWHRLRRYFVSLASTCMSLASVLESAGHDSLAMWKLYRETDHDAVREDFARFAETARRREEGVENGDLLGRRVDDKESTRVA